MKKLLLCILLPSCGVLLPACSVYPTVITPNGGRLTLGGSVFTKSTGHVANITGEGYTLNYSSETVDETIVPKSAITGYTTIAGIKGLSEAFKGKEQTTRALDRGVTTRAANKSAAELEKARIAAAEAAAAREAEAAAAAATPIPSNP
jgi:hypothetical protein